MKHKDIYEVVADGLFLLLGCGALYLLWQILCEISMFD